MVAILIVTAESDIPLLLKVMAAVNGETAKLTEAFAGLKATNDRTEGAIASADQV